MSKIVWNGGENPHAADTVVTVTLRNGYINVGKSSIFDWKHLEETSPDYEFDIVEYELGDTIVE